MTLVQVAGLVDAAPQLPHLFLHRLHPAEQLGRDVAATAAATAPARLTAQHLDFLAHLINLVLQRDPFPAVHLGVTSPRHGEHQQHRAQTANLSNPRPTHEASFARWFSLYQHDIRAPSRGTWPWSPPPLS